jgi:hypothetical protein
MYWPAGKVLPATVKSKGIWTTTLRDILAYALDAASVVSRIRMLKMLNRRLEILVFMMSPFRFFL